MASPIGHPNNQGNGLDQFKAQVKTWIKEEIANAARNGIGLHVDGATGNLIADQGNLESGNYVPGSSGWILHANGDVEFTGNTTIDGTLVLPNASVNNAALVAPVVPGVVNAVATNFAVPASSWATVVSFNATVPAGCTQLLALITGMAFVVNPNTTGGSNGTGNDVIECRVGAGGSFGMTAGVSIPGNNGQTSCPASYATLLTGLTPGGTVTLVTQAANGYQAFAANGANQANLCAQLLWLR